MRVLLASIFDSQLNGPASLPTELPDPAAATFTVSSPYWPHMKTDSTMRSPSAVASTRSGVSRPRRSCRSDARAAMRGDAWRPAISRISVAKDASPSALQKGHADVDDSRGPAARHADPVLQAVDQRVDGHRQERRDQHPGDDPTRMPDQPQQERDRDEDTNRLDDRPAAKSDHLLARHARNHAHTGGGRAAGAVPGWPVSRRAPTLAARCDAPRRPRGTVPA